MQVNDIASQVGTVLIAGYGQQGATFTKILHTAFGFAPTDLIVFDHDQAKLEQCRHDYPGIHTIAQLSDAWPYQPSVMLNLTTTASHLQILTEGVAAQVPHHLVEKPLVLPGQLGDLPSVNGVLAVNYLIRFSGALERLRQFMTENSLRVIQGRGFWSKDRTHDRRPTVGDLEDEATHAVDTLLDLVAFNQPAEQLSVRGAAVSYLEFADPHAQERAYVFDPSFPATPNSTSHFTLTVNDIDLHIHSCFVASRVERKIEVALAAAGSMRPSHFAEIQFDHDKKDWLRIKQAGKPGDELSDHVQNKQHDLLLAFFTQIITGKHDHRLATYQQAITRAKIAHAVITASQRQPVLV